MVVGIRNSALNLLAQREHSKLELQNKLIAKGFSVAEITKVVQELSQEGLQSDERFVEGYIAMRSRRGFGPLRIKAELGERGIVPELIEQFVQEYNWSDLIRVVRRKKFGQELPSNLQDQTKQMRYLYYKGFDVDLIKLALQ